LIHLVLFLKGTEEGGQCGVWGLVYVWRGGSGDWYLVLVWTRHQSPLCPLPQFLSKSRMLYLHSKYTEQVTNIHISTLKMEEACTSEMSATRKTTRCNNPRTELTPINKYGESLKSVMCYLLSSFFSPCFLSIIHFPCLSFFSFFLQLLLITIPFSSHSSRLLLLLSLE
jgi:hypothetical protein